MSLRVLLADESSTIKKVMQLALQDFNVEVKAVPVGLDVLDVCRDFAPDIVFADVLLAKRNGYEVASEVKSSPEFKHIPVVLMWSGFMELDETKAKLCKADRRLEKPFDADALRGLIRDLVPRTNENLISQFLSFPNMPEIEEKPDALKVEPQALPLVEMELDEPEDFQSVPLPKTVERAPDLRTQERPPQDKSDKDAWARQDLTKFKIPLEIDDLTQDYENSGVELSNTSINISSHSSSSALEEISLHDFEQIKPGTALPSMTTVSHERAEQIIREQAREVLENIAWKIIPDLAERIIREELKKLMKDAERI